AAVAAGELAGVVGVEGDDAVRPCGQRTGGDAGAPAAEYLRGAEIRAVHLELDGAGGRRRGADGGGEGHALAVGRGGRAGHRGGGRLGDGQRQVGQVEGNGGRRPGQESLDGDGAREGVGERRRRRRQATEVAVGEGKRALPLTAARAVEPAAAAAEGDAGA